MPLPPTSKPSERQAKLPYSNNGLLGRGRSLCVKPAQKFGWLSALQMPTLEWTGRLESPGLAISFLPLVTGGLNSLPNAALHRMRQIVKLQQQLIALAYLAFALLPSALAADSPNPIGMPKKGDPGGGVGAFRLWYADGVWHLRTSTENSVGKKDKLMVFTGTVRSETKMTVDPVRLEKGKGKTSDTITRHNDGKGFDFRFATYGAVDQADFKVTGRAGVLKFKLLVDGQKAPTTRILIGAKGDNPETAEFKLPAHPKK